MPSDPGMGESELEASEVQALVKSEKMVKADVEESLFSALSVPLAALPWNPRTEDTAEEEK